MEILDQIIAVFTQIDQHAAAFRLASGLRCPSDCGSCCTTNDIHTTPLEMMPLAHELLCRGEAQLWLDRIEAKKEDDHICVFYASGPLSDASSGHCTHYALRPAICRLFGFAAVRRRDGSLELAACKHLKQTHPQDVLRAKAYQNQAPCFAHFGTLLKTLDLSATELMPINIALRKAILRHGLQLQMAHSEDLSGTSAA
jgi:Fe-S-cluster containining protein